LCEVWADASKHDHPAGMTPFLMPRGTADMPKSHPDRRKVWNDWVRNPQFTRQESFVEATGEVGDVYLLHPFMLHSASRNLRREIRIITNPPVSLKEPFNYRGKASHEYSFVEQKTLRDLGMPDGLPDWSITASRERIVPDRVRVSMTDAVCPEVSGLTSGKQMQEEMKRKELERLKAQGVAVTDLEGARALEYNPA